MSMEGRIQNISGMIGNLPTGGKLALALFLDVIGFYVQPMFLLGALYTLIILVPVGYFLYGFLGLLVAWEILMLDIGAWVPTLFLIGFFLAVMESRARKPARRKGGSKRKSGGRKTAKRRGR